MKEPQGFIAANDYIKSVIQEDGFYVLAFITPGQPEHYQFSVIHNLPPEGVPSALWNINGNLFNSTLVPTQSELAKKYKLQGE